MRQREGLAPVTGWRSGTSIPTLFLRGGERTRERAGFPMGTPESPHPPGLSHTSRYTTCNPTGISQVQEETVLTKVQPAPQCLGRSFRGPGFAGRPGEQPQGQLPDTCPTSRGLKLLWPGTTGLAACRCPPLCGVLPLRPPSLTTPPPGPSASPQKPWPLCALSSLSCPVVWTS